MATHILATVRMESVKIKIYTGLKDETETAIRTALAVFPMPEGPYGPPRLLINEVRQHAHDVSWGVVNILGDLIDYNDADEVKLWWRNFVNFFNEGQGLRIKQAVIALEVDGQGAWTCDAHQVWEETTKLLGE